MGAIRSDGRHVRASSSKLLLVALLSFIVAGSHAIAGSACDQLLLEADRHYRAVHTDSSIASAKAALACKCQAGAACDTAVASVHLLISRYQFVAERFDASDSSARRAVDVLQKVWGGAHPEVLRAQIRLAAAERNVKRAVEADSLLHGIVSLTKIFCFDPIIEADACAELGVGHRFVNEYDSARAYFARADSIYETQTGDFREQRRQIEVSLGRILVWESRYTEAEILFERLIRNLSAICARDSLALAELQYHLGQTHRMLGKYAEAADNEESALDIRRRILGTYHYLIAEADHVLGMVYQDQGDYHHAKRLLEESLRIFRLTIGLSDWRVAGVLRNLARLHDEMGSFADAESLYLGAVANREGALGPQHPGTAQVVMEAATFYVKHGKYDRAESLMLRTLTILEKAFKPDHESFATALDGLGRIGLAQGRCEQALAYFKRARDICLEVFGAVSPGYALCQQRIATVYVDQHEYTRALPLFIEAESIMRQTLGDDHSLLSECLELKSACEFLAGNFEAASRDAQKAYYSRKRNFRANCDILSEADALRFADRTRNSADRCLSCFLGAPASGSLSTCQACDIILSAKGIVSDEIFDRRRALELTADPAIMSTLITYRQTRHRLSESFVQDVRTVRARDSSQSIVLLGKVSDSLESELALKSSGYREMRESDTLTAERLRSLIPEDARLIEYLKFNRVDFSSKVTSAGYVAAILGRDNQAVLVDLGAASTIDSLVLMYQERFRVASKNWPNLSTGELQETDEVLGGLYQKVIDPLGDYIRDCNLLLIAPDGALNLVSFGTLKDKDGRYLIEGRRLHYLSAAHELLRVRIHVPDGKGLLALGDPDFSAAGAQSLRSSYAMSGSSILTTHSSIGGNLRTSLDSHGQLNFSSLPYTRREILKVADFWQLLSADPAEVLLGVNATEERFKRQAPGKKVIHIATHAFFQPPHHGGTSDDNPESAILLRNPLLLSGLILAGADAAQTDLADFEEDGFLTADEVASMRLDGAHLVVLSACETGLGEIESGEGVFGLRRAFYIAGARTIVSSLWQVPDRETEMIMETLYSARRGTLDAAMQRMALRQIEQNRRMNLPDHPFLWGAFVAFGDWRALE